MNKILYFTLLLFPLYLLGDELALAPNCSEDGEEKCCMQTTDKPPFFVSDEYKQGVLEYENFRNINDDKLKDKYIPRGSIVYTPPELLEVYKAQSNLRVPVKVLSVPKKTLEDTAEKTSRSMFKNMFKDLFYWKNGKKEKKKRVEVGDIGYLDSRSLRSTTQYTFVVNEDAPLYTSPNGTNLRGMRLSPQRFNDQYIVQRCCLKMAESEAEKTCFEHHLFDVINANNKIVDSFVFDNDQCRVFEHTRAIPKANEQEIIQALTLVKEASEKSSEFSLQGAESLELISTINQWRGKGRGAILKNKPSIEMIKYPIDPDTRKGPFNSRHYLPDSQDFGSNANTDVFSQSMTRCAFMQIKKAFQKACRGTGCEVHFGNIYHGHKSDPEWGVHQGHLSGECIDVWPFRKTKDDITKTYTFSSSEHDREKTREFIELIFKAGGQKVFFSDPELNRYFSQSHIREELAPTPPGVKQSDYWWTLGGRAKAGHDDHIHFCLPNDKKQVQKTCFDGL